MDNKSQLDPAAEKKSDLPEKLTKPVLFGIPYEKYSEIYDMLVEMDSELRVTQEALEDYKHRYFAVQRDNQQLRDDVGELYRINAKLGNERVYFEEATKRDCKKQYAEKLKSVKEKAKQQGYQEGLKLAKETTEKKHQEDRNRLLAQIRALEEKIKNLTHGYNRVKETNRHIRHEYYVERGEPIPIAVNGFQK